MLGLHFVSTGLLPLKVGKTFTTLFEKRHSGDYDDFVYCDEEMVGELYPQAKVFVDVLDGLIKKLSAIDRLLNHKQTDGKIYQAVHRLRI